MKLNNKYFLLRHGEALSNIRGIVSSWPEKFKNPLTKDGKSQIKEIAKELKNKDIDLIFASDILRAKQTAEIIGKVLRIKISFDKRLREINFGTISGGLIEDFVGLFKNRVERINKRAPEGESYKDVFRRVSKFLEEMNIKYKGKNILIISHQAPLFLLEGYAKEFSILETINNFPAEKMLGRGEIRELN